jgi:maleylpyruvate isomerase
MDDATLRRDLDRLHTAHADLVRHLEDLTGTPGADPSVPSLLPGWTRGHLLSHISGNARSFLRQLAGAERGQPAERYPGGVPARDRELDEGATRPWRALVDDVRATSDELDSALAAHTRWDVPGINQDGTELPTTDVPFRRWRETLVHHADLGDPAYTPDDWPTEYVREELSRLTMRWNARLPMGATGLPKQALHAPETTRLLWLMGRVQIEGLGPAGVF